MLDLMIKSVNDIGLWTGANKNGIHFLAVFSVICYFGVFILQLIALVLARDDLERLFECSSITFVCGMGFIKLYSLYFNGPIWLSLSEQLMKFLEGQEGQNISDTEYDSDDEGRSNFEYVKLKENYEEKFKFTSKLLRRIYLSSVTIYILSPFIEYGFRSLFGAKPSKYPHILPAWIPLDDVHVAFYIIMVIVEAVAAAYATCVYSSFDITFIGIISFVCGQCNILFDKCARIGGRGHNTVFLRKRDERAHFRISSYHKKYLVLVDAISTLDSLCKNMFGAYFLMSTVTFCSIALRLKLESLSIVQTARLLQYASSMVFQLFLYCTYGDEVLNASSINMGEGPFRAAIWCLSPKIRREIVLLSIGMSRLRRLRAGPFNTVNLPSFVQIARAAYSCYAVVGQK